MNTKQIIAILVAVAVMVLGLTGHLSWFVAVPLGALAVAVALP